MPVFAQVDRGTLSGVVTDSANASIPVARVKVLAPATGFSREAVTDATGAYRFTALPIGSYTVTVSKEGFATARTEGLSLTVGVSRTLDFQLQIGQVATQVEVSATATPLEQNNADIGSVVEAKQIRNIPINGRNWNFLMMLAPGAVNTGEGTQNSIRFFGRSRDENNWTYDGVDATGIKDPRQEGGLRLVISLDSIAEFKVNSSTYTADGGTGAGGQVNLVSKSGTNDFHGSLFEFFRNDALDARRPFDPAQIPDFRLNQYGGSLGGRIVKDRTFFFLNYEGLQQRLGQAAVNGLVPSAAYRARVAAASPALASIVNGYPVGQARTSDVDVDQFTGVFRNRWQENAGSVRVDHRISDKHSIFGRFNITDGNFNDRRTALLEARTSEVRPTNATTQWTAVFSPTTINEARLGFNRSALTRPQSGLFPESFEIPGFTTTLGTSSIDEKPNSYSVIDHMSMIRGRHTLKFGGEIRRIQLNAGDEGSIAIRYASRTAFVNNQMDRFQVNGVLPMFGARRTYWIGYVQDEWRVTRNFVLNLGARYENYTVMTEVNGRGRVFDLACGGFCPAGTPWYTPDRNNLAPRFSLAWSIAPKTVIRSGYGIFYGPGQNDDVTAAIDSEPERLQLTLAQQSRLTYPIVPFLPEARSTGAAPRAFPRDSRNFYSQQWSFSIQQELPSAFIAQAAYVGNRGSKLFGRDRVNLPDPITKLRPLPTFSDVDRKNNWGNSSFHGLQSSLQRSFSKGWLMQAQYMWSKIIDDNAGSGDGAEIMIASCRTCERGVANWDVRHTFTANSVYELPFRGNALVSGWSLSGMLTARTGTPYTPTIERTTAAVPDTNTRSQRPNIIALDPVKFAAPANGTWGNAGRNILRAPGLWQMDFGVTKSTRIYERSTLEFRAEAFNLFNRAQLGTPASNLSRSDFGQIRTTANDGATGFGTSRMIQLMLRLNF